MDQIDLLTGADLRKAEFIMTYPDVTVVPAYITYIEKDAIGGAQAFIPLWIFFIGVLFLLCAIYLEIKGRRKLFEVHPHFKNKTE
jgi:hypothetical protein